MIASEYKTLFQRLDFTEAERGVSLKHSSNPPTLYFNWQRSGEAYFTAYRTDRSYFSEALWKEVPALQEKDRRPHMVTLLPVSGSEVTAFEDLITRSLEARNGNTAGEVSELDDAGSTSTVNAGANASADWSAEELRESVRVYLDMLRKHRAGEKENKAERYRALAARFGRTTKAFEYRMCNISYVLSVQGRAWLPGLLPRSNVGADVGDQIERFLAEAEARTYKPDTAFEIQVQNKRKAKSLEEPVGNKRPSTVVTDTTQYVRDPKVKAWVLSNSAGICECCDSPAPFADPEGMPYLEVHHVTRLADGGADTIANAVAVCPNCHRHLHHGKDALLLAGELRRRLIRLSGGS